MAPTRKTPAKRTPRPRKRGPKPKLDKAVQDLVLAAIGAGSPVADAARAASVGRSTLYRWLQVGEEAKAAEDAAAKTGADQPVHDDDTRSCIELFEAVQKAEADAKLRALSQIQKAARGGEVVYRTITRRKNGDVITQERLTPINVQAATWLLEHRWPEDFGRRRVELTGADGGPIEHEVATPEELRASIADRLSVMAERGAAAAAGSNGGGASH